MSLKFAAALLALLMVAIAAWGIWYQRAHPARILATGSVRVEDARTRTSLILRTRTLEFGAVRRQEVELPNGTWIDCGGDCADAVKRGLTEFWDDQQRRGS